MGAGVLCGRREGGSRPVFSYAAFWALYPARALRIRFYYSTLWLIFALIGCHHGGVAPCDNNKLAKRWV